MLQLLGVLCLHIAISFLNGFSISFLLTHTVKLIHLAIFPQAHTLDPWLFSYIEPPLGDMVQMFSGEFFTPRLRLNATRENPGTDLTSWRGWGKTIPSYVLIFLSLSQVLITANIYKCLLGTFLSTLHVLSSIPHNNLESTNNIKAMF